MLAQTEATPTLLQDEQVSLHGVLADALVFMRILLHLPHQTFYLGACALKAVPSLSTNHRKTCIENTVT